MNAGKIVFGIIFFMVCTSSISAFETHTHAYITYHAYNASVLGGTGADGQALRTRLGLDRLAADQPFSPYWLDEPRPRNLYYDNLPDGSSPQSFLRPAGLHEWWQMQQLARNNQFGEGNTSVVGPNQLQTLPIVNWLMRGVILEDQLLPRDYDRPAGGPPPDPDPRGDIRRVFNHFYDPIHDSELDPPVISCATLPGSGDHCDKAVDWALGTHDAFTSIAPDADRHNHFSWEDARLNLFLALTATRDADGDSVRSAAERAADAQERLFRWATVFRSLGDVIHLLQDTGQPQHTRNDRHDIHANPAERQAFEPFTNMRVIGVPAPGQEAQPVRDGENYVYSLTDEQQLAYIGPLPGIDGYPKPSFVSPLRYYTTRQAGDGTGTSPADRLGLADYTNRGFFTRGTLPDVNDFNFPPTPVADGFNGYTMVDTPCAELPTFRDRRSIVCGTYLLVVPDNLAPDRPDATTPQPLVSQGMWKGLNVPVPKGFTLSPEIFKMQGDLTVPRTIAYSAGLMDYFFRGQLEVLPPADRIVAVLNQGATHTMNAQGYPCQGTSTTDGCAIFGFEKVRVAVRNATATITESGTGTVAPQNTGGAGAQLVAVAKYHRNTCYKPDLSGERVQSYAPPPQLIITEPACGAGQTVRTPYQEVSVSAPLAVAAGELDNLAAGTGVDKIFDFTNDPIPVNATDLFIQVVYRGTLGQEVDGVAVGLLDTREPTFVTFWNNTDYWWNGGTWFPYSSVYPPDAAKDFWVCAGGFPVKLVFHYIGATGSPALQNPVHGSGVSGVVRLGFIFPPPDEGIPTQRKSIRGVPVAYVIPGIPQIPLRLTSTSGAFRQANKEQIAAATLAAPSDTCAAGLPASPEYWCFDTILERRNQLLGAPAQPFYLELVGAGTPADVDAPPAQSAFAGIALLSAGTVRFNTDATLANCPAQPTSLAQPVDAEHVRRVELEEEAAFLGIVDEE